MTPEQIQFVFGLILGLLAGIITAFVVWNRTINEIKDDEDKGKSSD